EGGVIESSRRIRPQCAAQEESGCHPKPIGAPQDGEGRGRQQGKEKDARAVGRDPAWFRQDLLRLWGVFANPQRDIKTTNVRPHRRAQPAGGHQDGGPEQKGDGQSAAGECPIEGAGQPLEERRQHPPVPRSVPAPVPPGGCLSHGAPTFSNRCPPDHCLASNIHDCSIHASGGRRSRRKPPLPPPGPPLPPPPPSPLPP